MEKNSDREVLGNKLSSPENSFSQFLDLPAEIRYLIWDFLLIDPPAVQFLTSRWFANKATYSHYAMRFYNTERTVDGEEITWRHYSQEVDMIRYRSILLACKESHARALAWVSSRGYKLYLRATTQTYVFVRSFDPKRDIFYVPSHNADFLQRVRSDAGSDRDMDYTRDQILAEVEHLAYPAHVICENRWVCFHDVFCSMPRLRTITAIWDNFTQIIHSSLQRSPFLSPIDLVQPRWELVPVRERRIMGKAGVPRELRTWSHFIGGDACAFERRKKAEFLKTWPPGDTTSEQGQWPEHIVSRDEPREVKLELLSRIMVLKSCPKTKQ